jgi:hypothetical protein
LKQVVGVAKVQLTAKNVMFYIADGSVRVNGTADLTITPRESGPYEGISFFQARDNTNTPVFNGTERLGGDGQGNEAGLFYFPKARTEVGGTGDVIINQLIAHHAEVYGTGLKEIHYEGGVPAAAEKVFLVQ